MIERDPLLENGALRIRETPKHSGESPFANPGMLFNPHAAEQRSAFVLFPHCVDNFLFRRVEVQALSTVHHGE